MNRSTYTETSFWPTGMASFSPNITPRTDNHAFSHREDERLDLLGTSFIGRCLKVFLPIKLWKSLCLMGKLWERSIFQVKNVGNWKVAFIYSPAAHGKWTHAIGDPNPAAGVTSFGSGPSGWTEGLKAQTLKLDCLKFESSSALHLSCDLEQFIFLCFSSSTITGG